MMTATKVTVGFRFRDFDNVMCTVVSTDDTTYAYECKGSPRFEMGTIASLVSAINTGWCRIASRARN